MKKVLVVGSLNMDMSIKIDNFPKLGETIFGYEYYESCGGKGANQAVAISKMEVETEIIGMIGNDIQGQRLIDNLENNKVKSDNIIVNKNSHTGRAIITVDKNGNNNIIVIPGSNLEISVKDINLKEEVILKNDIIVLQNEIPLEVVNYVLEKSKELNKTTIYNPAPAKEIDDSVIKKIDYLLLNETEMEEIFKISVSDKNYKDKILELKKEKGLKNIILTLGENGSVSFNENNKVKEYKAYKVKALDTTAAGDSFLGGFISKLCEKVDLDEMIKYATAVSAITVTRKGAQDSIPNKEEVEKFLFENHNM